MPPPPPATTAAPGSHIELLHGWPSTPVAMATFTSESPPLFLHPAQPQIPAASRSPSHQRHPDASYLLHPTSSHSASRFPDHSRPVAVPPRSACPLALRAFTSALFQLQRLYFLSAMPRSGREHEFWWPYVPSPAYVLCSSCAQCKSGDSPCSVVFVASIVRMLIVFRGPAWDAGQELHEVRIQVRKHFRPELLNHLSEIVIFDPLSHDQLKKLLACRFCRGCAALDKQLHLTLQTHQVIPIMPHGPS